MATWSDLTAFRVITEDGLLTYDQAGKTGFTLYDFEVFANRHLEKGEIAQWYVDVREDGDGDILAELPENGELVTFPAADLFD